MLCVWDEHTNTITTIPCANTASTSLLLFLVVVCIPSNTTYWLDDHDSSLSWSNTRQTKSRYVPSRVHRTNLSFVTADPPQKIRTARGTYLHNYKNVPKSAPQRPFVPPSSLPGMYAPPAYRASIAPAVPAGVTSAVSYVRSL